ncbi:MAG: type I-B CRISPR-associated protein Cas8b1/Cst1 [Hydrogenothermaceae bacterium]
MCNNTQYYKIYPTNWLMRAGILGFYRILEKNAKAKEEIEIEDIFAKGKLKEFFIKYYNYKESRNLNLQTFYNNSKLANNIPKKDGKPDFDELEKYFLDYEEDNEIVCAFCNERNAIKRNNEYVILDEVHFTPLGASPSNLKNFFWKEKSGLFMCLPCEIIIYCAAFGFTKFGNRYYFVDAPANIKELKEINDIWSEWLNANNKDFVLKSSFIEILKKSEEMKAKWSIQNISIIEISPISRNTSNIYNLSMSPEIAYAIRKRIQSYPSSLKDIYDIFLNYLYSQKSLYDMVSYILYGYLSADKLKNIDEKKLNKSTEGRLILSGMNLAKEDLNKKAKESLNKNLNNLKDLLFFIKFQKEVEDYGK